MYTHLTRSRTRIKLASPANLGLSIILIINLPCIDFCLIPVYASISHPPPTWGKELFNYFALYTRLMRSRIPVELAPPSTNMSALFSYRRVTRSPAYFG